MSIANYIRDFRGHRALVSKRGELITGPAAYSSFYNAKTAADNVAVNIVPPVSGKRFVIVSMVIRTDKDVTGQAQVEVFEATGGPTDATISKSIYSDEILKQDSTQISPNYLVSQGVWVNLKTDDTNAIANVYGYYVDA